MNQTLVVEHTVLPPWIRETPDAPDIARLVRTLGPNVEARRITAQIEAIWRDLLERLADPITVSTDETGRNVTFLDCIRYTVVDNEGLVYSSQLESSWYGAVFAKQLDPVTVDLPMLSSSAWIPNYMVYWEEQLRNLLPGTKSQLAAFRSRLHRLLHKAVRRHTRWRLLRHALRDALALDTKVLHWCRQGHFNPAGQFVTQHHYNHVLQRRYVYWQIEECNPNLVWVYNLMRDEGVSLPKGEVLAAIRHAVLREPGQNPATWLYLASLSARDVWPILRNEDAYETSGERWQALMAWLKAMTTLKRVS